MSTKTTIDSPIELHCELPTESSSNALDIYHQLESEQPIVRSSSVTVSSVAEVLWFGLLLLRVMWWTRSSS
jgi:hypothetical protein